MKFISVSELKNETSAVVRRVETGQPVVVMRHGKPCAAVIRMSENDLEQFLFEDSTFVRQALHEAQDDRKRGRYVTLKDYRRGKRSA